MDKNKKAYILWGTTCIVFTLLFMSLGLWNYETNDDRFLAFITGGFFGECSPYTIYNNIIQSSCLAGISNLLPILDWTSVLYITMITVSYIIIGYVCISKQGVKTGAIISSVFSLATIGTLINRMNFSKTGAFALGTGFVLLLVCLDKDEWKSKKNIILSVLASIHILVGSFVRYETTLAVIPFAIICMIYLYFKYKKAGIGRIMLIFAVLALMCASWGIHSFVYKSLDGWDEYLEMKDNNAIDFGIPEWESFKTAYSQIGFSENDVKCMSNWIFADTTIYNGDTFKQINDMKLAAGIKNFDVGKGISGALGSILKYPIFLLAICIFVFTILKNEKISIIICSSALIMAFAELVYLYGCGRCLERTAMIPFLYSVLLFMYFIKWDNKNEKVIMGVLIAVSILIFAVKDIPQTRKFNPILRDAANQIFKELSAETDKLFVWNPKTVGTLYLLGYGITDPFPMGCGANQSLTGGWVSSTPINIAINSRYGEPNVMKLLAENPNVYFISFEKDDCDLIEKYLKEHYNINSQCKYVKDLYGYSVYSFNNN